MRKLLSIMVALTVFIAGYGTALGDIINLPSSTRIIETEAFYGDHSIEEIKVPYGAEEIGARAFANSGLEKIYLPETVDNISISAFDGLSPDFTIYAPKFSFGYEYAINNDYNWKDSLITNYNDAMDIIESIQEDAEDITRLDEEEFSYLPTVGITDPEELRLVNEYNALQDELAAYNNELIEQQNELVGILESIDDFSEQNECNITDDAVELSVEGVTYTISSVVWEDIGDNPELVGVVTLDDGTNVMELKSNGKSVYIVADVNGLSRATPSEQQEAQKIQSITIEPSFASVDSSVMAASTNNVEKIMDAVHKVANFVNVQLSGVDNWIIESLAAAKQRMDAMKIAYDTSKYLNDNYNNGDYSANFLKNELKYDRCVLAYNSLVNIQKFWKSINIATDLVSAVEDTQKLYRVSQIEKHGHPTGIEKESASKRKLSSQLSTQIFLCYEYLGARVGYSLTRIIDGIINFSTVVSTMAGPGGLLTGKLVTLLAKVGVKKLSKTLTVLAVNAGINAAINATGNGLYQTVLSLDDRIHNEDSYGTINGYVYDAENNEKLVGAQVTCGDATTETDSSGYYELIMPIGAYNLVYKMNGYKNVTYREIKFMENRKTEIDVRMRKDIPTPTPLSTSTPLPTPTLAPTPIPTSCTVSGTVYDRLTDLPVPNCKINIDVDELNFHATSFTDQNGNYSLEALSGSRVIKVEIEGYIPKSEEVELLPEYENCEDIYIEKGFQLVLGDNVVEGFGDTLYYFVPEQTGFYNFFSETYRTDNIGAHYIEFPDIIWEYEDRDLSQWDEYGIDIQKGRKDDGSYYEYYFDSDWENEDSKPAYLKSTVHVYLEKDIVYIVILYTGDTNRYTIRISR